MAASRNYSGATEVVSFAPWAMCSVHWPHGNFLFVRLHGLGHSVKLFRPGYGVNETSLRPDSTGQDLMGALVNPNKALPRP